MPVTVTVQNVTDVAPELSTQSPERIELFIEYARLFLCEDKFGEKAKFAVILLTAHLLTLANRGGQGGAVSSESVGDLSRSFATGDMSDGEYGQTSYGQMFLRLRKSLVTTPIIVG